MQKACYSYNHACTRMWRHFISVTRARNSMADLRNWAFNSTLPQIHRSLSNASTFAYRRGKVKLFVNIPRATVSKQLNSSSCNKHCKILSFFDAEDGKVSSFSPAIASSEHIYWSSPRRDCLLCGAFQCARSKLFISLCGLVVDN